MMKFELTCYKFDTQKTICLIQPTCILLENEHLHLDYISVFEALMERQSVLSLASVVSLLNKSYLKMCSLT